MVVNFKLVSQPGTSNTRKHIIVVILPSVSIYKTTIADHPKVETSETNKESKDTFLGLNENKNQLVLFRPRALQQVGCIQQVQQVGTLVAFFYPHHLLVQIQLG